MKTLTHKKANFESLLDTAILIERQCSSMRGENEEGYYMGSEEEENLTLAELIDRELGPKTDVPYGDDPRADSEEYDMDEEEEEMTSSVGAAIDILSRQKEIQASKAPETKALIPAAKKIITQLNTSLSRKPY